ncbi:MAG: serine racemase VanT catalytic subunit [Clostridia bacterium]|nr:serine racemase VanT catalytic subunit [Clostridia bacterium]
MSPREATAGIDYFRAVAAFLVVANHTSPLSSLNGTADLILTRIIARIAVPFFFMTSGFFLLRGQMTGQEADRSKLLRFVAKTAMLYAIAILLYLPVNIYTGTFKAQRWPLELLKDLLFDGTFYHLWYLPATMIGATIAWSLLKRLKTGQAFGIALLLYVIGLCGDSYYGMAAKLPILKSFYAALFGLSDYTRNGLFFAPIFFMLGGMMAAPTARVRPGIRFAGLAASFALLLAEGLLLHARGVQRHDSMYLMLLPCMVFVFQSLLLWRGKQRRDLRDISMLVYLVHPLMIILVRGFAKAIGLQRWLIDNSVVHFLAVAVCSFAAATAIIQFWRNASNRKPASIPDRTGRAWAEISLANLGHNVQVLREAMPNGCALMAVVKGNAYGHGDVEVAKHLSRIGVNAFAVAAIDEAIHLRKHGIKGSILILGYTVPERAPELACCRLSQTVADCEHAEQLNALGRPIHVHIKVDTGMHRLGESWDHASEIASIFRCKNLSIDGIFTHLSVANSMEAEDIELTRRQIQRFYRLLEALRQQCSSLPKTHVQSSYGLLNYPQLQCDYARVGIALYGALSSPDETTVLQLDLRPVLSLKARIALVRTIATGESVGYGREFIAERDTRIAVLPIGYGDGVPRSLSGGKGCVLIHGRHAPIIGRICMDQLMVDVTELPAVKRGDVATLIGRDGSAEITAEQAAADAGTITNELLSRLGSRVERIIYRP